ncbi:hypothetical protein ACFKHW_08225 [Bradyrhizobium lupini]|uniref:hypothetical protein n=1 Tax=Rhizobium lupini TaxID=136996 RepID=UPI0036720656
MTMLIWAPSTLIFLKPISYSVLKSNRPVGSRLLLVRWLGGIAHLPVTWSSMSGHARGGAWSNRANLPLE